MNTQIEIINIVVLVVMGVAWVQWWYKSKGTTYRKYVLRLGVCLLIMVISDIVAYSLDIAPIFFITITAVLFAIYYYIKALIAQHRAKKKHQHDEF
jgi:hypothetical protein